MPPSVFFPPYYLGVLFFGAVAAILHLRERGTRRAGEEPRRPRAATALFIASLVLTGLFGGLTIEETVTANTWVYHYYLSVDLPQPGTGFLILPVPADSRLLSGLRLTSGVANWSNVATSSGPGLFVMFEGSCVVESSFETLAFFGNHPDDGLAPQRGNQSGWTNGWEVWIDYEGPSAANVNFQYGSGYVINGALGYFGPVQTGWNNYSMSPAP